MVIALSLAPALFVTVGQAVANKILTGDFSAAGALVKLELHDPRLSAREVWDAWLFHVRYQIARVTGYHVADGLLLGSVLWAVAALPLFFERTRRIGLVLWSQALLWVLVVGGHNDRAPVAVCDFRTFLELARESGRLPALEEPAA